MKNVVAILAVRNEELYIGRCLKHLASQGVSTCLVDNGSNDKTLEIAREFLGHGLFRIETWPFKGYFDLKEQMYIKSILYEEIDADWFIHVDADEILESPDPDRTLAEAIAEVDNQGYNLINFNEFTFVPTHENEFFEGTDYVEKMQYYYFFEPSPQRLWRAWKKGPSINLSDSGGHLVKFENQKIYPHPFVLRHYIGLSQSHLTAKYQKHRRFSHRELAIGWHGWRGSVKPESICLPKKSQMKLISGNGWDTSDPRKAHAFLDDQSAMIQASKPVKDLLSVEMQKFSTNICDFIASYVDQEQRLLSKPWLGGITKDLQLICDYIQQEVDRFSGAKILQIGSGQHEFAEQYSGLFSEIHSTTICPDEFKSGIKKARQLGNYFIHFQNQNVPHQLPENFFDYIINQNLASFSGFWQWAAFLLLKTLKPGGFLILQKAGMAHHIPISVAALQMSEGLLPYKTVVLDEEREIYAMQKLEHCDPNWVVRYPASA